MQMAFFVCTNSVKSDELMSTMSAEAHWYYTKNKKPVYVPNREILQGLGEATKMPLLDQLKADKGEYPELTLAEADAQFDVGKLLPADPIVLDGNIITYGRAKISAIIGENINDIVGSDEIINASNIVKIMAILMDKTEGTEMLRDLQNFSVEVLKRIGITTLTLRDLYVDSNKYASGFNKIINSDMSERDKDFELTRELGKVLDQMLEDLPKQDLKKTIEESNRYKPEQLTALIGPTIIPTDDGYDVEMSSYLDSKGTRAYVEDCINNRTLWQYKQAMVPMGGYNARQLNVTASIQFVPNPNPNTEIEGIYLPNETEKDLKRLEGREIIGEAPIKGFVEVRSCIFNGEKKVYSNEIDSSIYKNKQGELHAFNIGIDMESSMSESFTQSSLGLKHGGKEWTFTDECFRTKFPCEIIGIEDEFIVVKDSKDNEFRYRLPVEYELTSSKKLDEGEILFTPKKKVHLTKKIADISTFLDTVTIMDGLSTSEFNDCYSFKDGGEIHYSGGLITIGNETHYYDPEAIYYYAEGEYVAPFSRICSGIVNMGSVAKKLNDKKLEFIIFRKQLLHLLPSLNPDICEIVFKTINNFGYSITKALNKGTNLISSLYMGSPEGGKKVLTEFVNNGVKLFDENDLLYKLIFQQGLAEGANV